MSYSSGRSAVWIRVSRLGLAVMFCAAPAVADDVSWNDPTGGDFSDLSNWSTGLVPGAGDDVFFDLASIYTVSFTGDATNARAHVLNDKVTWDLGGFTYLLDGSAPQLLVGGDPSTGVAARLTLLNGTLDSARVEIAPNPGEVGTVEVGPGAAWILSPGFGEGYVGKYGTGRVEILNGGLLDIDDWMILGSEPGSIGTLSVVGPGSLVTVNSSLGFLTVGRKGFGELFINGGGSVLMPAQKARIASRPGTDGGVAVVSGDQSIWHVQLIDVGERGPGTLLVLDGGTVLSTASVLLARDEGGSGWITVSGPGSLLAVDGSLSLSREGEILVEAGATLTASSMLGVYSTAATFGSLTVTGAGTSVSSNKFALGESQLLIEDGGVMTQANDATIPNTSEATVTGVNSIWNVRDINVGGDFGQLATLTVEAGGTVESRDGEIGIPQTYRGSVLVTDAASVWNMTRDLFLGSRPTGGAGDGLVTIANGASGSSDRAWIATAEGAVGELRIMDPGSSFTVAGEVFMGTFSEAPSGGGQALLAVSAGAALSMGQFEPGPSATISIEVSDALIPVQITGAAKAGGTLDVTLADGFDPPEGETIDIILAGSVVGQFDTALLPVTPSGDQLYMRHLSDRVRLFVGPEPCPWDCDGSADGVVSINDFLAILNEWGMENTLCHFGTEPTVGIAEFLAVLGQWGACPN